MDNGRTVAEQELINSLGWLIRTRWLAGAAVLFAAPVATRVAGLEVPSVPLLLVGGFILLYNALLRAALDRLNARYSHSGLAYQWFARVQIGLDWVAMTAVVALSGGIESPALPFFLFHIAIASMLLPHDRGFLYVSLGPLLVGLVAWAEYVGRLPHVAVFSPPRHQDATFVAAVLFFFACAAYVMAYFAMAIARRIRRRENELSGLYMSVRTTSSTLDLTAVLDRLTEATAKVLDCKAAAIRLLDNATGQITMVASCGLSQSYREVVPADLGRAPIDRQTLSGKTVLVGDVKTDPRIVDTQRVVAEGIGSMISTPLVGKGGPLGVLRAYGSRPHQFTTEDADFLSAVAAQGAVAIENAQAYELLQKLNEDKSRFARIATHELRSPVQVSQNLLAVVAAGYAGELTPQQADMVGRALRRIQDLQKLIDDLLDLAAAQAKLTASEPRGPVTLNQVVARAVGRHEGQAQAKELSLSVALPQVSLIVWGDEGELDRVVENLVANAIKYTPRGEVKVSVERQGDAAVLRVSDTGIGIPEESLPRLFREFYRAPNAKAIEERGTGLGLSIVRDLVERCGGTVTVASQEGRGATFTVHLPLARNVSEV
ncbi:MAG: GAF domain-containing sensor histidine kinase [Acidobacteria bacterium]|nr:MAG: GAF domain-containing sensor histidine kinase [Acidobacteriota bacterium]